MWLVLPLHHMHFGSAHIFREKKLKKKPKIMEPIIKSSLMFSTVEPKHTLLPSTTLFHKTYSTDYKLSYMYDT